MIRNDKFRKKIISTTLLGYLLESAESDISFNNESKRIYNKIKNNINKIKFEPTVTDVDFVKDNKGNLHSIYGVKFNLKQIDKKYDLNILFAHSIGRNENKQNNHHYDYKNNRIIFFILSQSNKEDFENNERLVKLRFSSWIEDNVFIHEFTHYLDSNRYSSTYSFKFPNNAYGYYNSAEEFNAYSQEIIKSVIKNKNKLRILEFELFLTKSLKFGDECFISNLNDKNMKRLKSRLYKLYTEIKEV